MAMIGGPGKPSQSVPCEHGRPHKQAVQKVVMLSSEHRVICVDIPYHYIRVLCL